MASHFGRLAFVMNLTVLLVSDITNIILASSIKLRLFYYYSRKQPNELSSQRVSCVWSPFDHKIKTSRRRSLTGRKRTAINLVIHRFFSFFHKVILKSKCQRKRQLPLATFFTWTVVSLDFKLCKRAFRLDGNPPRWKCVFQWASRDSPFLLSGDMTLNNQF